MEYEHHDRVEDFRAIAEAEGDEEEAEAFMRGVTLARKLGAGDVVPLTVSVPEPLLDYLDERGVPLRQDLMTRAFQLLVVELESGQTLVDL